MQNSELEKSEDFIASKLRAYAQNILAVIFGLLPLLFVPMPAAPFEYTKILFVFVGIVIALVLYSLSLLRSGPLSIGVSYPIILIWAIVGIALVSALFSGDLKDSLMGDVMSTHSTAFLAIVALGMSVWVLLNVSRVVVMRLYIILAASTIALVVFHLARLLFGSDTLGLGIFMSPVSTPLGSWNDLALFLGLSIILSLVAIEQLSLTRSGRILFAVVTIFALVMLAIINFFIVWIVLGLTGLTVVVYGLSKDRYTGSQLPLVHQRSTNMVSLSLSLLVFAVSVLFVIGGSAFGAFISKYTGVSYIEVRPSLSATIDIARSVYQDNAFFGIGPNRFMDAWRLYKDPSINQTVFWNTDFNAGNGYITSFFVTTGILGGLAWLAFLASFLLVGMRLLFTTSDADRVWYFIGVSSFVSAVYIWGMSIIYVPGAVVLLIGALCTAITLTAYNALRPPRLFTFSIMSNQRTGFVVTLAVIAVIIGSVSLLYAVGRHYAAAYTFNTGMLSLQQGGGRDAAEATIANAHALYQSDLYARRTAEFQFARMTELLGVKEPTQTQQNEFNSAVVNGLRIATQAKDADPSESANWAVLGALYSSLASVNVEGVYAPAKDALTKAIELNPRNPVPYLELAILEGRTGNYDSARSYVESAINLKSNYTDAFFYLSQIDIATNNVKGAIESTQSVIRLDPQNPARYFQLGVLEMSQNNTDGAILAFEGAVNLDTNYANARYLLALAYDAKGRTEEAREQLERVLQLNPGNQEVTELIHVLEDQGTLRGMLQGGEQKPAIEETVKVKEEEQVKEREGVVSTDQAPDSPLVTPVNIAPEPSEDLGQGQEGSNN